MVEKVVRRAIHTTRRLRIEQGREYGSGEGLVVLAYADNTCYTKVLSLEEARKVDREFRVDADNGTWTMNGGGTYRVGTGIQGEWGCRGGIIGVYDSANLEHLNSMVHKAREATRGPSSPLDD